MKPVDLEGDFCRAENTPESPLPAVAAQWVELAFVMLPFFAIITAFLCFICVVQSVREGCCYQSLRTRHIWRQRSCEFRSRCCVFRSKVPKALFLLRASRKRRGVGRGPRKYCKASDFSPSLQEKSGTSRLPPRALSLDGVSSPQYNLHAEGL